MSLHIDPLDGTSFGAVVTGAKMASLGEADWQALNAKSLCFVLSGEGAEVPDDSFLVMMSANDEPTSYRLPAFADGGGWEMAIDTRREDGRGDGEVYRYGSSFPLAPRSVMAFILRGSGT